VRMRDAHISDARCGTPGAAGGLRPTHRKSAKDGAPEGLGWSKGGEPPWIKFRGVHPHLRHEMWGTRRGQAIEEGRLIRRVETLRYSEVLREGLRIL